MRLRRRFQARTTAALLAGWLSAAPAIGAAASLPVPSLPQRIASLNLCVDQLLLLLVDRERIVSVTDWSQNPESSYMAAVARGLPINHGLAEEVLPQRPDLILSGPFDDNAVLNMLRQLGYPVAVVGVPRSLVEARTAIREFGAQVGATGAAAQLVASMDRRLAAIDLQVARLGPAPLAAVYAPNGVSAGAGTVMHDILGRAGLRNLAAELGLIGYGQLPLEQLLLARPDFLIFDAAAPSGGDSLAHRALAHPALAALQAQARVVHLPPPLSVCVGPMTVDAIERLVAARLGRREPAS